MHAAPSTVAPLLLALVLGVSGVAKARHLSTAADAFVSLRLPRFLLRWRAPQILPFAELLLAVLLLVCAGPVAVCVTAVALAVFVAYLVVILRALTFRERVTCSCFGELGLGAVDWFTAVRNGILVVLAVLTLVDAAQGRAVFSRMADFTGEEWTWLAGVLAAVVLTWLVVGQHGAEASAGRSSRGPGSAGAATPGQGDDADYARSPIPIGRLRRPDNASVTLRGLARSEAVLLLYVSPTCGSCVQVIEKARTWQHETDAVHTYLVLPMPPADEILGLADPESFDLLFDPQSEMFNLFETGTPSAVLLGADGLLAGGPVVGYEAVSALMDDVLAQLTEGPARGDAGTTKPRDDASEPVAPAEDDDLEYVRHPTPYGLLHTREGAPVPVISLADTAPTVLLMVSPSCGSCLDVIAETPAWRAELTDVPVALVVSDEAAAERVEEILDGPAAPIYLDENHTLLATFGAGTPTLVALGPDRRLLAGPVTGKHAIRETMADIITEVRGLAQA